MWSGQSSENKNRIIGVFAFLILFLLVFDELLSDLMTPSPPEKQDLSSKAVQVSDTDERITRQLQRTEVQQRLERMRMEVENERARRLETSGQGIDRDHFQDGTLDNSGERNSADSFIRESSRVSEKVTAQVYSEIIREEDRQLQQQEQLKQQERNRRAYIRQFIENARKEGIEVIVDENMQVIATRPLSRNPSSSRSKETTTGR